MSKKKEDIFLKIPEKLYEDKNLSINEVVLIARIHSLDLTDRGCFSGNKSLGEFMRMKPRSVANMISRLRKNGYIEFLEFDGHNRSMFIPSLSNDSSRKNRHSQMTQPTLTNDTNPHSEMHEPSSENEQSIIIEDNIKDKGEENTPPPLEKSEKPNLQDDDVKDAIKDINRQKFGPTIEEELYAIMAAATDTHFGPMTTEQRKTMKKLFYQIRDYLQDYKKRVEKNPYYNASSQEIKEHFKDFCNDLPDFVKQQRYTPAYLNMKYGDLLIEIQQKKEKAKPEKVKPKIYQMKKRKR